MATKARKSARAMSNTASKLPLVNSFTNMDAYWETSSIPFGGVSSLGFNGGVATSLVSSSTGGGLTGRTGIGFIARFLGGGFCGGAGVTGGAEGGVTGGVCAGGVVAGGAPDAPPPPPPPPLPPPPGVTGGVTTGGVEVLVFTT